MNGNKRDHNPFTNNQQTPPKAGNDIAKSTLIPSTSIHHKSMSTVVNKYDSMTVNASESSNSSPTTTTNTTNPSGKTKKPDRSQSNTPELLDKTFNSLDRTLKANDDSLLNNESGNVDLSKGGIDA